MSDLKYLVSPKKRMRLRRLAGCGHLVTASSFAMSGFIPSFPTLDPLKTTSGKNNCSFDGERERPHS